nr:MAG TPA: hypothetical protein [Caudoviricetes sp.]
MPPYPAPVAPDNPHCLLADNYHVAVDVVGATRVISIPVRVAFSCCNIVR